mmetsp:Transcript_2498/g.3390  ORF Transcript_2498/g.3390 Transcript_2498/m.3390 type:complete len:108 (+) Transcript_2498:173-496(+)
MLPNLFSSAPHAAERSFRGTGITATHAQNMTCVKTVTKTPNATAVLVHTLYRGSRLKTLRKARMEARTDSRKLSAENVNAIFSFTSNSSSMLQGVCHRHARVQIVRR